MVAGNGIKQIGRKLMGKTIQELSKNKIGKQSVFPHRFCVEICEQVHIHYKNLRIATNVSDFMELVDGLKSSFERWQKRGKPMPKKGAHIELCRRHVDYDEENDDILINLNHNLYKDNKDMIFAEGANLDDDKYIHLKIRDLRLELSLEEFKELADAVGEAKERLKDTGICAVSQET